MEHAVCVPELIKDSIVKTARKAQAPITTQTDADTRPTITIARVMSNTPDTASFSGWGPKVSGVGNLLKNWN